MATTPILVVEVGARALDTRVRMSAGQTTRRQHMIKAIRAKTNIVRMIIFLKVVASRDGAWCELPGFS